MASEATFTIPSDKFPLGSVFQGLPGVRVELERIVPASDVLVPYIWVRGAEADDIVGEFDEHPGVQGIRLVDTVDHEYLLRVEWTVGYDGVLNTLTEMGIPLVSAAGTNEEWTFEIRGDDRDDIAAFHDRCLELDIPITLTSLHALTPVDADADYGLTDPQREMLVRAYERGYFNSPRDVTMEELGEEFGISEQAVASRLRRSVRHVVEEAVPGLQSLS